MKWPLALVAACSLGAQAAGLPQRWARQAQDFLLWRQPQTGVAAVHHTDQVQPLGAQWQTPQPQSGEGPPATVASVERRSTSGRSVPAQSSRRQPVLAPQPEPRAVWHTLLTEAEQDGPGPELYARVEAEAAWLEQAADADLLQRLGWVLLADGRTDQAERWFARALAQDPDSTAARKGLASSLAQRGQLAAAYALLAALPEAAAERRALADTLAEQARVRGADADEALWLERALAETVGVDLSLHERLAWNAQRQKAWAKAIAAWRQLLAVEDRPSWREALATGLQAQGELAQAHQVLQGLPDAAAWRAALALSLADRARAEGRTESERAWLQAALREDAANADVHVRLAGNAEARAQWEEAAGHWSQAYALRPEAALAEAWAGSLLRAGREAELARLAQADDGPLARWWQTWQARRLLAQGQARAAARVAPAGALPELNGVLAPRLGLGLAGRSKSGHSGGSRLRLKLAPQLRYAAPHAGGWIEAELNGVAADAGMTTSGLPFGSEVPGQGPIPTRVGASLALQLRWSSLAAAGPELSIGTTAAGAPVPATATLTLAWRETRDDHAWRAALYREPVRDSVLSLLGQRDPTSGESWGRVMRDGLSLGGHQQFGAGPWSLAGQVRIERLTGRSVDENQHLAAQIELMHSLNAPGFRYLLAGPTLGWEGYRRDLSAFTWGHGGYFSPRDFTQVGAALQFETADRPDWRLAGRLSGQWQRIAREAAPCHPLPPPAAPTTCSVYPGERKQGLATQVELRAVTRLAPRWQLAGAAGYRHGPAYRDHALGLTLVHLFEPQTTVHSEDLPAGLSALW